MLHALLEPTSPQAPTSRQQSDLSPTKKFYNDGAHNPKVTYIPPLRVYMPHTWRTEPNTTATVAKADNAAVNTHMWDARITAIWHTFTPRRLILLRRVALGFICKSLYKEFCTFMSNKYNTLWSSYIEGHSESRDFRGEEGEFGKSYK